MYTASELAKILRDNGCKVTPQRLAVYDMLSHTTEHPTAEMIYQMERVKNAWLIAAKMTLPQPIFARASMFGTR